MFYRRKGGEARGWAFSLLAKHAFLFSPARGGFSSPIGRGLQLLASVSELRDEG
jgi:hypothetical protein